MVPENILKKQARDAKVLKELKERTERSSQQRHFSDPHHGHLMTFWRSDLGSWVWSVITSLHYGL